jgi:hypothetical protein
VAETQFGRTDRAIRWTTIIRIVLAIIAAIVSYKHMYLLVRRYGETSWTAALLPISVDGMIAVSSMSLLMDSRHGTRSGVLPWTLLVIGSAASLAANVAVAEPSAVGRLIAGWPSCALIGSYELLMRQIRHTSMQRAARAGSIASYAPHTTSAGAHTNIEKPHTSAGATTEPSDESVRQAPISPGSSEKSHTDGVVDLIVSTDESQRGGADGGRRRRSSRRRDCRGDLALRQRAWRWAVANRTPEGELLPGKEIAREFGRSERWGRLVKQAGLAGRLDETAA